MEKAEKWARKQKKQMDKAMRGFCSFLKLVTKGVRLLEERAER